MKKWLLPALAAVALVHLGACKDDDDMDGLRMTQLEDSIGKYYPTTQAFHINPEDRENLFVVLGNIKLYQASPEAQQQAAMDIGRMAVTIWGKDSYLHKGQLVLTRDITNNKNDPKDGIVIPINVDSLRKGMFGK